MQIKKIPRTCCAVHKKHDKREPGLFKEEFRCTEMLCLCSKTYCCYDSKSDKFKFSSKGFNKRTLEDTGDGPMSKYRRVLDEAVNLKSNNRGFKTSNHLVGTYEQNFIPYNDLYVIQLFSCNITIYSNLIFFSEKLYFFFEASVRFQHSFRHFQFKL